MASVQIYGMDDLVTAVRNRDCPSWAIFDKSQFLFKREDTDIESSIQFLERVLESIQHSRATYTIKFYEGSPKIKQNTPCDGSLNFVLTDEESHGTLLAGWGSKLKRPAIDPKLEERLERIEAVLTAEVEEVSAEKTIGSIAMDYLSDPQKLLALITGVKNLFADAPGLGPMQPLPQHILRPAAVGSVGEGPVISDEERYQRVASAIDRLEAKDPAFLDHLEKLAALAEKNPAMYQMAVKLLENQ